MGQTPYQWGLKSKYIQSYQYSAGDHFLAINSKYTQNNYISTLSNWMYYSTLPNLYNNQLEPVDYLSPSRFSPHGSATISRVNGTSSSPLVVYISGSTTNYAKDFEEDANGNYVVLLETKGNGWNQFPAPIVVSNRNDSTQIVICKIDLNNVAIWQKVYGGTSAEYAIAIKKASDGNYIILAQTQSNDGDVTGYNGGKDIWLIKIDNANGNIIWKKAIGTNKDEIPTDMELLADGSIVVSGSADASSLFPSSYNNQNAFLLKLDGNANLIWTKTFSGSGVDQIKSFVPTADGGYVSIGTSTSADGDYPVNNGGSDVYILKHNSTGAITWRKQYGFADNDFASDIAVIACDTTIYASWFRQYGGPVQAFNIYPAYSQNAGVRVVLKSDGTQSSYYQENFTYHPLVVFASTEELFNDALTPAIISNNKGGILCTSINHARWVGPTNLGSYRGNVTRTYSVFEYGGTTLNKKNKDTTVCKGQPAYGQPIFSDTTYSDTLRNNCYVDTLITKYTIHVINADSVINKDTTICYGEKYKGVQVFNPFVDNDTTNVNTICGVKLVIKKISITVAPKITNPFGKDSTLCKNQSIILKTFAPATSYLWQDNSTQPTYNALSAGLYWVEVKDNFGCKKRDSINIVSSDLFLTIPPELTVHFPDQVILSPQTNGNITWVSNNTLSCTVCQSTVASPVTTVIYALSSAKGNCTLNGSIKVNVIKGYYLFIPNTFTPNGDTKNDVFKVTTNYTGFFTMEIFNRYGERIFSANNPANGWDGRYKGAQQPLGGYTYIIKYQPENGGIANKKGNFLLIR
ncbi:gliding motility-associated C-terminal domain-containing protein [Ferruginibacter profundus]